MSVFCGLTLMVALAASPMLPCATLWAEEPSVIFSSATPVQGGGPFAGLERCEREANQRGLPQPPPGYEWRLVPELSDEFDGEDLDTTKWMPYHPYWDGREPSQFDTNNVVVQNGLLELRTTLMRPLGKIRNWERDPWIASACLSSRRPQARYGYYEAKMKASRVSMTSSFWLQGKRTEIDICEQLGGSLKHPNNQYFMWMNTHFFQADNSGSPLSTPQHWQMPSSASAEYHIYGCWWKDPNTVWLYHNGQKVAEIQPRGSFSERMWLFFTTEAFTWEGLPSGRSLQNPWRNTMYVDWVRSWQLVKK